MTKGRIERRLAVIMATDIVGYSRLMEADEGRTLDAIMRLQASIFSPNIDTRAAGSSSSLRMEPRQRSTPQSTLWSARYRCKKNWRVIRRSYRLANASSNGSASISPMSSSKETTCWGTASTSLLASRHRPSREGYASPMACIVSLAESAGPPSWTEARYPSRISPDPFTSGIQVYANSRAVDVFGIGANIDCGVTVRESLQLADQTFFSDGITEDIIGGLQFSFRGSGRSTLADSKQVVPLRPKRRPLRPPVVRPVSRRLAPGSRRPA